MSYSYERATRGMPAERKSPLKRVPGMRNARWDASIGRWVVTRVISV